MSIDEYVRKLVADLPPLTEAQVESAARILAGLDSDAEAA